MKSKGHTLSQNTSSSIWHSDFLGSWLVPRSLYSPLGIVTQFPPTISASIINLAIATRRTL